MAPVKKAVKTAKAPKAEKSKKSAVPKTDVKNTAEITAHIKEISGLLKKLSYDDLKYILQQSKTLIHNQSIKDHNKQVIDDYNINVAKKREQARKSSNPEKSEITIKEAKDNSYFFIRINQKSSSFVLQEMKKLVKISHAGTEKTAGVSIYHYLRKERSDVIETQHITGPQDSKLSDLAKFLRGKYTVNT